MFLECNNHEAHGPTDYHAYATISNRQKQFLWTYIMYVLTSATDSFNIHTSLVWLGLSLSLCMQVITIAMKGTKVLTLGTVGVYTPVFSRFDGLPIRR